MDLPDDVVLDAIVERIVAANARAYALWTVLLGAAGADELVAGALEEMLARRPRCEAASVRPLRGQRPPSQPTTGATKPQIQATRKPTTRIAPTTENRVFRRRPCGATPIGGTAGGAAAPGAVNGSAPAGAEAPVGRRGASTKTESANTVGSPRYSVVQAASLRVLGRLLRPALRRGRRIR